MACVAPGRTPGPVSLTDKLQTTVYDVLPLGELEVSESGAGRVPG